jgi:hypothetical protein
LGLAKNFEKPGGQLLLISRDWGSRGGISTLSINIGVAVIVGTTAMSKSTTDGERAGLVSSYEFCDTDA